MIKLPGPLIARRNGAGFGAMLGEMSPLVLKEGSVLCETGTLASSVRFYHSAVSQWHLLIS